MRKLGVVAVFGLLTCAACSLLVDTDGLSDANAKTDAGTLPEASSGIDARVADANITTPDDATQTPVDAGADADADASTLAFCASHANALFCDDFDQPGRTDIKTEGWGGTFDYPLAVPSTVQFFSPPKGAFVDFDPTDSGAGRAGAYKVVAVPSTAKTVTVSFRVRPELSTPGTQFYFNLTYGNCAVELYADGNGMTCTAPLYPYEDFGTTNLTFERWNKQTVKLTVRPDGADAEVTIGEGAQAISSKHSINVAPAAGAAPQAQILIGDFGNDSPAKIYFDDILVEAN